MSDDGPLFQNADEQERIYAPQEVPDEQKRVLADDGRPAMSDTDDPPSAAPIASFGTSIGGMAAPNIGDQDRGGAAGDPQTEARDPFDDRE